MSSKFYVYIHRMETDGSIFYVGKGHGRRAYMKYRNTRSQHWLRVAAKNGFTVEFAQIDMTEDRALLLEQWLIAKFRHEGFPLVNATDGGEGNTGFRMPVTAKDKIADFNRDKSIYTFYHDIRGVFVGTRKELSDTYGISGSISSLISGKSLESYGWRLTKEKAFRKKSGVAPKFDEFGNPKRSPRKSRRTTPIKPAMPIENSLGMKFEDIKDALAWIRSIGFSQTLLYNVLKGKINSLAGASWWKTGDPPVEYVDKFTRGKLTQGKKILCSNGIIFNSSVDAAKWVSENFSCNGSRGNISNCCANRGGKQTYYGLKWSFLND